MRMEKINNLDDVVGFLTSVAEYALAKPERIQTTDGAIAVVSENYQTMQEVIEWVENECKRPKKVYLVYAENFNGSIQLKKVCAIFELAKKYKAEYDKKTFAYIEAVELEETK